MDAHHAPARLRSDPARSLQATKTPSSGPPALSATDQAIHHRRQQQHDRQREQAALVAWEAAEGGLVAGLSENRVPRLCEPCLTESQGRIAGRRWVARHVAL